MFPVDGGQRRIARLLVASASVLVRSLPRVGDGDAVADEDLAAFPVASTVVSVRPLAASRIDMGAL